ncbi:MinD/ParA family protein [Anaerosporobacter faecicola]|uniref:MinD/ParA family protein n=1 Tax=Anaerosporobacter faecicola TaxID=2718714 RepID=UPI00143A3345|nr:MinD/ParA family protein [Anaerosporobacter faecicola]
MDQAEELRRMIEKQNQQKDVARVITVTSGKGGVGKSNISVNLAVQLSRLGKRVIILDADFGLANVEIMLGIRPKYNLADLMFHGKTLREIITEGPQNIGFISGGSGIDELANLSRVQLDDLRKMLYELDDLADVIIVDTGAGISDSVLEFVAASSEVILVTTPEPTSITDAYALLKTLVKRSQFSIDDTIIKIVSNRVDSILEGKELYNKLSMVVQNYLHLNVEFLGAIPMDMNVSKAVIKQKPVSLAYPNSDAAKAMYEMANVLCNEAVVEEEKHKKKGISHLFSNLVKFKKNRSSLND